jgi:lytic murein transglycosylase
MIEAQTPTTRAPQRPAGRRRRLREAMRAAGRRLFLSLAIALAPGAALAVPCGGDFDAFIAAFSREAASQNVSVRALAALDGVSQDPQVVALDRRQGVFKQSFEQFALPRISARLAKAQRLMAQHAAVLSRIEQRFGVPAPVLVAIWGLETDFGVSSGKRPVITALATLAHDCRRSDMFQGELLAALRIIERGDLSAAEMRGAWAGELGQTQFLPSSYLKFAVDFDGNGRRDLIRSVPDVLASTANYLKSYGWQRGQPWTEGSANFAVLKEWNKAAVYQRTIALFAARLAETQ